MLMENDNDEFFDLPHQEFTSCKDLAIAIKIDEKTVKKTKQDFKEKVILKDSYILAEQFTYSPEKTEEPMFVIAMTENPFQTIKINLPIKKIDNIKPLYKTFEYSISGVNNSELINSLPVKVDLEMILNISIDEKAKISTNLTLNEVVEKQERESPELKQKIYSTIKQYPFLIGFVGIKKMIIPILFDDDSVSQDIKGMNNYFTFTGKGFSQFLTRVDVYGENSKQEIKVPVFLTKPKLYVNMSNLNKDEITLMRATNYQVDNYTFQNTTTFIPIIFGDIAKTISDLESTNQISELKMATYVNSIIVKEYKNEIETLIQTPPLSIEDIRNMSMTVDEIKIFTQVASMLIKDKYKFTKEDLQIIKAIYNVKTLLVNNKPFISRDMEILLSIISFYETAKVKNPEYSESQSQSLHETIKAIIDREYAIDFNAFKDTFIKRYGVSEKKFDEIIENVMDNEGYLELRNGNEIILAKSVESFLEG